MARTGSASGPPEDADSSKIVRCAWCGKVRIEGSWYGGLVADAFTRERDKLTHGICPHCFLKITPEAMRPPNG